MQPDLSHQKGNEMRILLMMASLVLAACYGGVGGGGAPYYCYSDGPLLSNLVLSRSSAVIGEGGGSISVEVTIDYKTRSGAKIIFVNYRVENASGQEIVDASIDNNLKGSGSYTFNVPIGTEAAGTYTVRVRLFDECLEKSKWLDAEFDVSAPAALSGRTGYATAQSSGLVYFIGGRGDNDQVSDTLLQYDPATRQLQVKAAMPEGREFAAAAAYNGVVYVFGGMAYGFAHESTFAYDSATDTWTAAAPVSNPISGATAAVSGSMIYLSGENDLMRYDPILDLWAKVSGRPPSIEPENTVQP
jgi:hypothetical protein